MIHQRRALRTTGMHWWEYGFLVSAFSMLLGLNALRQSHGELSLEELMRNIEGGSTSRQLAFMALGTFAAVTLSRRLRSLRVSGSTGWMMVAFYGWAVLSIVWADDPVLTVRRIVALACVCGAALAIAVRMEFEELPRFVLITSGAMLGIGVMIEISNGTLQPLEPGYRLSGQMPAFYQALNCAALAVAGLACARGRTVGRRRCIGAVVAGVVCLLLTRSRGPTGAFVLGLVAYGWYTAPRRRIAGAVALCACIAIIAYWSCGESIGDSLQQAALLGRDETTVANLTGRLPLWEVLADYVAIRPVRGYGYDSFWTPARVAEVSRATGWDNDDSHNGFLDVALSVGLPGLAAYGTIVLCASAEVMRRWKRTRRVEYLFAFCLVVMHVINMTLVRIQLAPLLTTFAVLIVMMKVGVTADESGSRVERRGAKWDAVEMGDVRESAGR